ncbi:Hypothetical predicted protein [Octopus vulgaris]|nr:Hypothetical predicted protein [Octopus vulgaris]
MQTLAASLFLISFFCAIYESVGHKIVPNGTIYLGESTTLYITIPNIKRPVVWQSLNYKYECDRTCADGDDYKVTLVGNTSSLWIRNVSWKFSTWVFSDDNLQFAKIDLDINVKPEIEIKHTNCEYTVKALCSLPVTHIECRYGKEHLNFVDTVTSNCPDGQTLSNVDKLRFSKLSGNVTCTFTLDKIFREDRTLQVECDSTPWICSITFVLVCVAVLFVMITIAVIIWCIKIRNGEDSALRSCIPAIGLLSVSILLFIVMIVVVIMKCLTGKESLFSSRIPAIVLLVSLFLSLIMAGYCLFKKIRYLKLQNDGNEKEILIWT